MTRNSRAAEKHWRRLGLQCVALLERARDQATRIILLQVASTYARLSERGETNLTSLPPFLRPPISPVDLIHGLGL